jgi:hypothetical protein
MRKPDSVSPEPIAGSVYLTAAPIGSVIRGSIRANALKLPIKSRFSIFRAISSFQRGLKYQGNLLILLLGG